MTAASTTGDLDPHDFAQTETFRRELTAHCYRMVGSLHESEDLVQETYVRAWRSWDSFEGRSSVRTWLYSIATNVCLTSLQHRSRRTFPTGLGAAQDDEVGLADRILWLDPYPDAVLGAGDPADVADARSGLRLALLRSIQLLPPRQRAVFVLREAHGFSAAEIAGQLGMTEAAVKSALQRARATIDKAEPVEDDSSAASPALDAVLDRYMSAFESADVEALADLLRADAVLAVHPDGLVQDGKLACVAYLADHVLTQPSLYRMVATRANGQPAAVAYRRDASGGRDGLYLPLGVAVLEVVGDAIRRIDTFVDPDLVTRFGCPADYAELCP